METYQAEITDIGKRFDVFLSEKLRVTRSHAKLLIENGHALLNSKTAKPACVMKESDSVQIEMPPPKTLDLTPSGEVLDIVFENDAFAVINKPQGMVVHPAPGAETGTLVNALLSNLTSLSTINGVFRPGIVHRLDKDTSGLIAVAKNDAAHQSLSEQISKKEARRIYRAVVDGNVKEDGGILDFPIGRSKKDRKKMAVVSDGRQAVTLFRVLERFGKYTYMEFELKTGRTHQIRVHMKHIGHPIIGDGIYGGSNTFHLNGQLLHAYRLILHSPTSGEEMRFTAPLPDYFEEVLRKLRKNQA